MSSKTIDLTPERWARVESLFEAASRFDTVDRVLYLDSECADDPELREYVEVLLNEDDEVDSTIQKTIADTVDKAFGGDDSDSLKGEMIGPYRVERLIGAGGMGMVYLAQRADDQFEQQVAIKLGRHRLVDPQTELRLKNERQILSDLDHPNIAKLFDGGTTADGVPYLVMEYIDGTRIDEYCDNHRLDVVARLRLFETICAAVHNAHQNLIIHRDIKASNILVTEDGTPKLLDFGIAKLTDTQGAATDGLTREGSVIMTPENAAPEQVLGRTITTATDTHALGMLLYNLLTGTRAFGIDDLAPSEIASIICEQDPVRPSQRLLQLLDAPSKDADGLSRAEVEAIGHCRQTTIEKLSRRLRGDIDMIVLNALRKEPERRYGSVATMAADIDLHLRSMPILARPDSWRYRAGKFARRHYAGVTVSALVVAMLAAFTVLLTIQNQRISAERDRAREVSQFLEDVFSAPDPNRSNGVNVTARELLDAGANRIRIGLGNSPEIQSELMSTIGRVYFNLGVYEPSVEMLESALELRIANLGPSHPDVAAAQNDLARSLIWRADYDRARPLLEEALATSLSEIGEDSPEVAAILINLAEMHLEKSDYEKAESLAETGISNYEQLGADYAVELAAAKALLARILQVRDDLDRTEELLREAIDIITRSEGANDASRAFYLQNLGVTLRTKGDFEGAAVVLDDALSTAKRVLGDRHDLVAAILIDQGRLLQLQGRFVEAETVMRNGLALNIELRGQNHPFVGVDMIMLGMLLHDKDDLLAAEDILREALGVFERSQDTSNQYTASALTELGAVFVTTERAEEALPLLERAMEIRAKEYQPENPTFAATQTEYGDALARLGRFSEAEPILTAAVAVFGDRPGRRANRANEALARFYRLSGRSR